MATFDVTITGRSKRILVPDKRPGAPKGAKVAAEDTSPMRKQYLSARDALIEAPQLAGVLQENPGARVELPGGETMSLAEWIELAARTPVPPEHPQHPERMGLPLGELDPEVEAARAAAGPLDVAAEVKGALEGE